MNETLYTPRHLSQLLGVTTETLIQWEKEGKIKASKTPGGHRRYIYSAIQAPTFTNKRNFIYARVSSRKQQADLQRQVEALQARYPTFEVITDVASGINFRRRGLVTLLDNVIAGNVSSIVVAHRDRLCRFGFDMFTYIFERFGVTFEVLQDDDITEPVVDLAKDLLSIVTVFTARYHGSRKYEVLSKDQNLSKQRTGRLIQPMHRGIKVLLQPGRKLAQRKRLPERDPSVKEPTSIGHEE